MKTPQRQGSWSGDETGDVWEEAACARAAGRKLVVATVVLDQGSVPRRSGAKMLVFEDGATRGSVGGGLFEKLVMRDALAALAAGRCAIRSYSFQPKHADADAFGAVCGGKADVFLEVIMAPDRLLIVGGGHCGRALAQAASLVGFSIVVADDREEYAQPGDFDFPGVKQVLRLPPDFAGLPAPDEQTYVVLVSKGFATDEAALRRVLGTPAAYIGMIGSLQKRDHVYDRLRTDGVSAEALARVHAPVGLEIGAETPAEIAVSILAEIVQMRAQRQAGRKVNAAQEPQDAENRTIEMVRHAEP